MVIKVDIWINNACSSFVGSQEVEIHNVPPHVINI